MAQIERLKDKVAMSRGKMEVKAYLPKDRDYYATVYNSTKGGAYRKVTACRGDQPETVEDVWPSVMFDALNTPGVATRVEMKFSHSCRVKWFDTSEDELAMNKMFDFLIYTTL